jgi:DNA-3-methyladenine glycosylase II
MKSFRISPTGPFTLEHSARFLCGFTPGAGTSCANDDALVLGFLSDADFEPTVVSVKQVGASIHGELRSGDAGAIRSQVERLLSLDHDATGLERIARRDKVIAALLQKQPGFRPVCFPSPYEAAIWGVLAQRMRMSQAANIKRKLAIETDSAVEGFGRTFFPSPRPDAMLRMKSFPGISEEKMDRLHGLARAALEGKLDPARLRAMSKEDAIADLQKLRGVGQWTAGHIFLRGTGIADELPGMEPRVLAGVAKAYRLRKPTFGALEKISEGWRPFRMWISILIVSTHWTNPPRTMRA